jgi:hypothetical protein
MDKPKGIIFEFNITIDPNGLYQTFIVGPFNFTIWGLKYVKRNFVLTKFLKYGQAFLTCSLKSILYNSWCIECHCRRYYTVMNTIVIETGSQLSAGLAGGIFGLGTMFLINTIKNKKIRKTMEYTFNIIMLVSLAHSWSGIRLNK